MTFGKDKSWTLKKNIGYFDIFNNIELESRMFKMCLTDT